MMTTSLRTLLSLSRRCFMKETTPVIIKSKRTWTVPVKNNYVNNFNKLSVNDKNCNYEPRSRVLIITSFGLLGFFSADKDEEEAEPELIMTIKRSILLIQKGEFKKAEQMLHVALRQAQQLQNYDGITYVYDVMANLAFEIGDIEKAQKLFKSVMQRLISTGTPENDIKIIHMSLKMAKLCEATGESKNAEDGYLFCLKHIQDHAKLLPDDDDVLILWAMSLDWYGKLLLSQSRLSEALDKYLEAYQLCVKVHGKEHEQTAVILNDLGTVYCLLGQHDQALEYLSEAIAIGKRVPDMEDLCSIYVNLGNVYLKKSMHNEAKKSCTKALDLSKKHKDQDTELQANYCLDEIKKSI